MNDLVRNMRDTTQQPQRSHQAGQYWMMENLEEELWGAVGAVYCHHAVITLSWSSEETELDGVIILGRGKATSYTPHDTLHRTNNVIRKHSLSTLPVMKAQLFSPLVMMRQFEPASSQAIYLVG